MDNLYKQLSNERKQLQEEGRLPTWFTTAGWQLFKQKYLYQASDFKEQVQRIAKTAAQYSGILKAEEKFFNIIWNGWLSCSTPILANMGTTRGLPVSCSGTYIEDSIDSFYTTRRETALLTKHGFGTSAYLGAIRPRGSSISKGGSASGVLPVIKGYVQDMRDVSQGSTRRGAWAGYLEIDHPDFDEVLHFLETTPDDVNLGWIITDNYIDKLNHNDSEALRKYQKALKVKMITGKGYFFFKDKVNRKRPAYYLDKGWEVSASNLCSEITLYSGPEHTFTCVLSSLNLAKYDEWKYTDAIEVAIEFLDCVALDFIAKAKDIPGMEKAVRFTEETRALGLGVCGFHTLLQQRGFPFESLDAHLLNLQIFDAIHRVVKSVPYRDNTHVTAIAPTKSTSLIMGGVSEGINPDPAMVYQQTSAGGELERVNPILLEIMKEKGIYNKKTINDIIDHHGSVQHVKWLSPEQKKVFKTAFEIDQRAVLRLASHRAKFLDQWQSINLFFSADETEEYISAIHKEAFLDENILALYYCYSKSGVQASKDNCEACQ